MRSEQGRQTSTALADLLWTQPHCFVHCALTAPPAHENTRTGQQGHSEERHIAVSEQRKSIIKKCLAVGWRFLVQAGYSCHLKSGNSYMSAKICLGKKNPNIRTTANDWELFSTGVHSHMNSENVKFRAGDSLHNKTLHYCFTT